MNNTDDNFKSGQSTKEEKELKLNEKSASSKDDLKAIKNSKHDKKSREIISNRIFDSKDSKELKCKKRPRLIAISDSNCSVEEEYETKSDENKFQNNSQLKEVDDKFRIHRFSGLDKYVKRKKTNNLLNIVFKKLNLNNPDYNPDLKLDSNLNLKTSSTTYSTSKNSESKSDDNGLRVESKIIS